METYYKLYVQSGGIMMFVLIPCSLLAIGYIIQGFINLRHSKIIPRNIIQITKQTSDGIPINVIHSIIEENDSVIARTLRRLLNHHGAPQKLESDIINEYIEDEIGRTYQRNSHLIVIYTVAPLLGLLGTVLGMMKSFYLFSTMENPSVAALSRGINEALVTTMWGLFIAIPAFVVVNIFRYRLLRYQRDIVPHTIRELLAKITTETLSENEAQAESSRDSNEHAENIPADSISPGSG